jgi:hypothetical protein
MDALTPVSIVDSHLIERDRAFSGPNLRPHGEVIMRRGPLCGLFLLAILTAPIQEASAQAVAEWTLGPRPLVEIGGEAEGPADFLRIQSVLRLGDGRIVVADRSSSEIRIFDRNGQHLATFGRNGSGPGEFQAIGWAGRSGDTLLVDDLILRRVTLLTLGAEPSLASITRLTAPSDRGSYSVVGRLSSGAWVVATGVTPTFDNPQGVHRVMVSYGLVPSDGQGAVRWLGEYPSAAVHVHNPSEDMRGASVGPIAFSPWHYGELVGATIWLGDPATDSLLRFTPPYSKAEPVSLGLQRRRPSREQVRAARDRELEMARSDQDRARIQAKYSRPLLPEFLPYYRGLLSTGAELWIHEYGGDPNDGNQYLVLGSDGTRRGRVVVPPGFRIHDAGQDYVLGVYFDEDDVERVRLYRLTRK